MCKKEVQKSYLWWLLWITFEELLKENSDKTLNIKYPQCLNVIIIVIFFVFMNAMEVMKRSCKCKHDYDWQLLKNIFKGNSAKVLNIQIKTYLECCKD